MEWTIVVVRIVARWLDRRPWILIGDARYACILLGWECLVNQATLPSRLRLDARLFRFPEPVPSGRRGPKPQKGAHLTKLAERSDEASIQSEVIAVPRYSGARKTLRVLSDTALWHTPGITPLVIRWVLVVDPEERLPAQALFTTALSMTPARVVALCI